MIFGRHEMDVRNNIQISNANFQSTEDIQFFGKTIYRKLNFNNILKKENRVSGMIWRGRNVLSQKFLKNIVFMCSMASIIVRNSLMVKI